MIYFEKAPKVALDFMNDDHEEATRITNKLTELVVADLVDQAVVAENLRYLLALGLSIILPAWNPVYRPYGRAFRSRIVARLVAMI